MGILFILSAAFIIQLLSKAPARRGLFGILFLCAAILLVFGFAVYESWQQYYIWENNDLSKFFLPPHRNFDYFVFYVRSRFFNPYLLSLFFGFLFLYAAKILNKKYSERFFEPVEPYLLGGLIFLLGHPLWFFYLIIVLTMNFLLSTFYFLFSKKKDYRFSFYYMWLPSAIFTILISRWLSILPWWQLLKF